MVTTTLLPSLATQMLDSGAKTIIAAAWGISTAPAFTVE